MAENSELPGGAGATIALTGRLDTAAAKDLHDALTARAGGDVTIDGTEVELVGGRCVDILLSAQQHWSAKGHSLTLTAPSDAMVRDITTLGAAAHLLDTGDTA